MENIISIIISVVGMIVSVLAAVATSFLTIGRYKEKVDQLEKKNDKLSDKMDNIRSDVDKLIATVASLEKTVDRLTNVTQTRSPISLTPKGEKLVEDSGFNKIFEENKDRLARKLHKLAPRSQYEVQEKARMLLTSMVDDEIFKPLEGWAYDHGEDVAQILRAGSIKLRDYYFEKHPEITKKKEQY